MEKYMEIAYKEALKAYRRNEVPVGAVIVKNNKIIAKARNNRQKKHNILGHAEINCILKAEKKLKDWRLDDCTMYVTLKPCEMCSLIIKEARIKNVEYLIEKNDSHINNNEKYNKLHNKYLEMLKKFFVNLR